MSRSLSGEELRIGNLKPCKRIIQGGMAVRISEAPLAAAVANEGGIGVIGASGMNANWLRKEIRKARSLTNGIIGVNIMVIVKEFEDLVQVAVSEADLLIIGAGFPDRHYLARIKDLIPTLLIISDAKHVPLAMKLGLAGAILESGKAGGHLGANEDIDIWDILGPAVDKMKAVKKEVDERPSLKNKINPHFSLIAAGGILTGYDIARALGMGASGVQMGTLFAVALESSASDEWKQVVCDAKKDDIITIASPIRPNDKKMPLRVVKTPFVEKLLMGNIPKLSFEFQDKFCKKCLGDCDRIYCIFRALLNARNGKIDYSIEEDSETIDEKQASVVTIGYRGYEIMVINRPVKEIIKELESEFAKY